MIQWIIDVLITIVVTSLDVINFFRYYIVFIHKYFSNVTRRLVYLNDPIVKITYRLYKFLIN